MKENIIKSKSVAFALRIVKLYHYLMIEKKEYILSKQLLIAGTANGAMVREAERAESKADFIHKMSTALKEANETEYWLKLLQQSEYLNKNNFASTDLEIKEILRLLISIIKSSK